MTPESPEQTPPGTEAELTPKADHGEESYRGTGRLSGKVALVTGADSGIGKAVAIAFAREGADVAIAYLDEHEDAEDTAKWVREAGREALLLPGDLRDPAQCRAAVSQTVETLGHLEVLASNAAFQMSHEEITDIPDEEWDRTIATNLSAYFHLVKAAIPHLRPGASIIATSSVQSDQPSYQLLPYAATKSGMLSMTASFAQALGEKGIRANAVAPGPIWTPLIPSTMPPEAVASFGENVPLGRPGQPAEVAHAYVLLASDEGSYMSGATIAVTGGKPIL
jgi:NAD(P)-dependent dehydrogenase (short-subunit alcohol dehydrogenase family)